ncbi:MAG: hypothetical protein V6Z89_20790 [Desulfobacter sp.]
MMQKYFALILCAGLIASGCVSTQPEGPEDSRQIVKHASLENWLEHGAIPYLIRELGESPKLKGQPLLLVGMEGENIQPQINSLTLYIRDILKEGLLSRPGIELLWRPSTRPWQHHTTLTRVKCRPRVMEKFYIGIDTSISPVDGELKVRIKALDIEANQWVSGFGISWHGKPKRHHKEALGKTSPDHYLLGLRPLPFNDRQADLLAAYLSRNLSCLFTDAERSENIVYIKTENVDHIDYFDSAYSLIKNYLAMFSEVMVTDEPSKANITIIVKNHEIRKGLYQVWVNARFNRSTKYLPGKETVAYVALSTGAEHPKATVETDISQPGLNDFNLYFHHYPRSFSHRIYPMLKRYPGAKTIKQLYHQNMDSDVMLCYQLTVSSNQYGKMEELVQWLDAVLLGSGIYRIQPISNRKVHVFFSKGFD